VRVDVRVLGFGAVRVDLVFWEAWHFLPLFCFSPKGQSQKSKTEFAALVE
jgi:hypothetical protein